MAHWEGIEEFVAIATHGSFVNAALALGLSRTHMSRSMAALEDRLQVRLLNRTTRSVTLTSSGEMFLDHCRRLVAGRDEAIALVTEKGDPQGHLQITCSTALGERFVAPIARRFALQFPKVRVSLDLSNRLVDLASEGFDLAIRTGHLESSSLIATRLAMRQLHTCASPTYLSVRGVPDVIEDLRDHDCLIGTATVWHFRGVDQESSYRPQGRWKCNNGQAVLAAALEDMGICQLPDFYVERSITEGMLVPVLRRFAAEAEAIWAVYPSRRYLAPKVALFIDALKTELPRMLSSATG